jgi:hypothetical protein
MTLTQAYEGLKKRELALAAVAFALGVTLYALAVVTSFTLLELRRGGFGHVFMILLTTAGGALTVAIGYGSVVVLGGMASLKLAHLMAIVGGSTQVVEEVEPEPTPKHQLFNEALPAYIVGIVFITAVALSWDFFNLDGTKAWIFYPLVHALDIFAKPPTMDLATHSLDIIPTLVILVTLGGIAPAIALPFFRKFKVTGVNSGTFHTTVLLSVVGLVVGLSAVLTLVGLIYRVLWVGSGTHLYHYALLAILGLSIDYGLGAYLARDRSEELVRERLKAAGERSRVHLGTVTVQRKAHEESPSPGKQGQT